VLRSSDDVIDIVERPVDRALPCAWAGHAFAAMVRRAGWGGSPGANWEHASWPERRRPVTRRDNTGCPPL
jgi:hypothetical protein